MNKLMKSILLISFFPFLVNATPILYTLEGVANQTYRLPGDIYKFEIQLLIDESVKALEYSGGAVTTPADSTYQQSNGTIIQNNYSFASLVSVTTDVGHNLNFDKLGDVNNGEYLHRVTSSTPTIGAIADNRAFFVEQFGVSVLGHSEGDYNWQLGSQILDVALDINGETAFGYLVVKDMVVSESGSVYLSLIVPLCLMFFRRRFGKL